MSETVEDIGYFGDEVEASEDTLAALTQLCEGLSDLRLVKSDMEDKISEINALIKTFEEKTISYFKEYGLPSLKLENATYSIIKRKSFAQPASPEDRAAFFGYLRSKGLFDSMISVNSRTLTSWASREVEEMEKEGRVGWLPPGLSQPSEFESIGIRKK
jgi:hypothetical protein